ncbi:MAG: hypothetical protein P8M67_03560 [Opitutales bacterium]|nr:hypothetical protein [Opitutales bacterium]
MDSFNTGNVSQSIINQLNSSMGRSNHANLLIQKGEKLIKPSTDVGGFTQKQIILSSINNNRSSMRNSQNALSFTQAQDSSLANVGSIISRMMVLKTNYEGIAGGHNEKSSYDEEFKELQLQLKNIREGKFNEISLFSHSTNQALFQKALNSNNLISDSSRIQDSLIIDRAGLLGALKITKNFDSDTELINATGGPEEFRLTKNLKSSSGELTWWQWAYKATDNFQAFHGSEKIHEKSYGSSVITLNNGKLLFPEANSENGGAGGFPDSDWLKDPSRYGKNKDIIEFGRNGNRSNTIEFLVNESGQVSGTGWHMEYRIDYDPVTINLMDDSKIYSLTEVDQSDFVSFESQILQSRAENAAVQQRIMGDISSFQSKLSNQSSNLERHDGLDIARTMSKLNIANTRLSLNAKLIKSAQDMENKIFTDFL